MRTVSSLESFHSSANRSMPKKGNFFRCVVGLRLIESRKADTMMNLVNNIMPENQLERKHSWDRERDQRIKHFTELICKKKIPIKEFLQEISSDKNCMYFIFFQKAISFTVLSQFLILDLVFSLSLRKCSYCVSIHLAQIFRIEYLLLITYYV